SAMSPRTSATRSLTSENGITHEIIRGYLDGQGERMRGTTPGRPERRSPDLPPRKIAAITCDYAGDGSGPPSSGGFTRFGSASGGTAGAASGMADGGRGGGCSPLVSRGESARGGVSRSSSAAAIASSSGRFSVI